MPYKDEYKCDKVIDEKGIKCNKSPARLVPILNFHLCKEHQEEMGHWLNDQLGEYDEEI